MNPESALGTVTALLIGQPGSLLPGVAPEVSA